MDPITIAILILSGLCVLAYGGAYLWLIFRSRSNQTKKNQDDNILKEDSNETQIAIDNQIQQVQEKFNTPQQEFNNATAVYNKDLTKGFEYLEKLEMEYNNIIPSIEEKEKTAFQLEFEKLLDVKQIIDEQLDNAKRIIIDDANNEDHKDTDMFNVNDIKANIEEYKSILNNLIENAENEEIKLAFEGKYGSYGKTYDYILNKIQNIVDATNIKNTEEQNRKIEQIINPNIIEQNLMNKIIDGDNNYISSLKDDDNTLKNVILWINSKVNGLNDLGNRIIKANNNDVFPSPDGNENNDDNNKNNNQANFSQLSISAMLDELDKD